MRSSILFVILLPILLILQSSCKKKYKHTEKRGLYLLDMKEMRVNTNTNDTSILKTQYEIDFNSASQMFVTKVNDTLGFVQDVEFQYEEINELFGRKPGMTFSVINPMFSQNTTILTIEINNDHSEVWQGSSSWLFAGGSRTYYTGDLTKK